MKPVLCPFDVGLSFEEFDCGDEEINNYLRNNLLDSGKRNYTKGYAVCLNDRVIGFSALASYHLFMELPDEKGKLMRVPGVLLGQLAVDRRYQGEGVGDDLIEHAISVAWRISGTVGCRIVWVEAYDDLVDYYDKKKGFEYVEKRSENRHVLFYDVLAAFGKLEHK